LKYEKKVYRVTSKLSIVERSFRDKEQYGHIIVDEDGKITISIRHPAPAWQKVLAFQHEMAHLNQFLIEDVFEKARRRIDSKAEKIAHAAEYLTAWACQHLDWFSRGVYQLQRRENARRKKRRSSD